MINYGNVYRRVRFLLSVLSFWIHSWHETLHSQQSTHRLSSSTHAELRVGLDAKTLRSSVFVLSDLCSLQASGLRFRQRRCVLVDSSCVDDLVILGPSVRCGSLSSAPTVQQPRRYGIGRFMSCGYWLSDWCCFWQLRILVRHYVAELSSLEIRKKKKKRCLPPCRILYLFRVQ